MFVSELSISSVMVSFRFVLYDALDENGKMLCSVLIGQSVVVVGEAFESSAQITLMRQCYRGCFRDFF